MTFLTVLDYIGVFVFAMSGVLAASEKRLDLFGGFIIAFVTAMGGGTLRDVLMNVDVAWVNNIHYVYIVILGTACAVAFKKVLRKIRKTLFLFDTIGISLFAILGAQKAIAMDVSYALVVLFAVVSATFGGITRDTLCNEIPLIFRKEVYATACIVGALIYVALHHYGLDDGLNAIISGSVIFTIRTVSVVKKISIPVINDSL